MYNFRFLHILIIHLKPLFHQGLRLFALHHKAQSPLESLVQKGACQCWRRTICISLRRRGLRQLPPPSACLSGACGASLREWRIISARTETANATSPPPALVCFFCKKKTRILAYQIYKDPGDFRAVLMRQPLLYQFAKYPALFRKYSNQDNAGYIVEALLDGK